MPTIQDFKQETTNLLVAIEDYKSTPVVNPYKLLTRVAMVLSVAGGVVAPELKVLSLVFKGLGRLMKAYSEYKGKTHGSKNN